LAYPLREYAEQLRRDEKCDENGQQMRERMLGHEW
jgi:hypothetical protein